MKLTIFNCSPKLGKNNTGVMLEKFIEGFEEQKGNETTVYRLNKMASMEVAANIFSSAETVLIAFPLYTYAMPSGLKLFIETLEPLSGKGGGKKLAFLVQYGFAEAIHARPIEKFNMKLASRLGCEYAGTIIKGGCDGLTSDRIFFSGKILKGIKKIGIAFGKTGKLNKEMLDKYSAPEFEKNHSQLIMDIVLKFINWAYWKPMLKKNGVKFEDSYAKPYENNM